MGFFDFMKKKKTEEVQPDLREPERREPVTPSQLFAEEPEPQETPYVPEPTEIPRQEFAQAEETALLEQPEPELAEGEREVDYTDVLPEQTATGQPEETLAVSPNGADPEGVLPERPAARQSLAEQPMAEAPVSQEPLSDQNPDSSPTLDEPAEVETLDTLESDNADGGETVLPQDPIAEAEEPYIEPEPQAAAETATAADLSEPIAAEPEYSDNDEERSKKRFMFFGKKEEQEPSFEHAEAVPENKRIKELHRDVKDLREERNAFTNRFERTYAEQNRQINSSFNGLKTEIRQDIRDLGREFNTANSKANGDLANKLERQTGAISELDNTVRAQSEQIAAEGNRTRSEVQVGFAREKVAINNMSQTVEGMGAILVQTQQTVTDKLAESGERAERNRDEIVSEIQKSHTGIMAKLNEDKGTDADLDGMTPAQHYRNMKYSVCALVLAAFAALLLLSSCLQVFKWLATWGSIHAVIILDFVLVYLFAGGGFTLSMIQKKLFFQGAMRAYWQSKNPAHTMSKISMLTALVTACVNTLLLLTAVIALLIVAFV